MNDFPAVFILILTINTPLPMAWAKKFDEHEGLSAGAIVGIVIGCLFIAAIILVICCSYMGCYLRRIRSKRDEMLTGVHDTPPNQRPPLPTPPPAVQSYNPAYNFHSPPPMSYYDHVDAYPGAVYPNLGGFVQKNAMATTPPVSYSCNPDEPIYPKIERTGVVMAAAPLASLESLPQDDLSNSSAYRRLFAAAGLSSIGDSIDPQPPPLPSAPPLSTAPDTPSSFSRVTNAFRDVAKVFRFPSTSTATAVTSEDTATLEEGTRSSISMTGRLFKQNTKREGSLGSRGKKRSAGNAFSVLSSGVGSTSGAGSGGSSRIWRKNKAGSGLQCDEGHYNEFDLAEIEEMESSIDNDRFLHSLESAIFTSSNESPSLTAGGSNFSPFYSTTASANSAYSPTFKDGDLGTFDASGRDYSTHGGLLYPPLPPGSPVVGFAYLGLGGAIQEEEKEDAEETPITGTPRSVNEAASGHETLTTLGNERDRAANLTPKNSVRLRDKSASVVTGNCQRLHESSDSANSTTEMLHNSAKGERHSISTSDLDLRPSSGNMESWVDVSDQHMLISHTGQSSSQLRDANTAARAHSSSDLTRP